MPVPRRLVWQSSLQRRFSMVLGVIRLWVMLICLLGMVGCSGMIPSTRPSRQQDSGAEPGAGQGAKVQEQDITASRPPREQTPGQGPSAQPPSQPGAEGPLISVPPPTDTATKQPYRFEDKVAPTPPAVKPGAGKPRPHKPKRTPAPDRSPEQTTSTVPAPDHSPTQAPPTVPAPDNPVH